MQLGRLDGKTIFMTAASAGIGGACALASAREGARVIATDRDEAGIAEIGATFKKLYPGLAHEAYALDVTDTDALRAAGAKYAEVDVLFNGAGWVHEGKLEDTSL